MFGEFGTKLLLKWSHVRIEIQIFLSSVFILKIEKCKVELWVWKNFNLFVNLKLNFLNSPFCISSFADSRVFSSTSKLRPSPFKFFFVLRVYSSVFIFAWCRSDVKLKSEFAEVNWTISWPVTSFWPGAIFLCHHEANFERIHPGAPGAAWNWSRGGAGGTRVR